MIFQRKNNQKGVSLIMAFFVMVVVISVVLSVSSLLYSEIKIIRNMSDSVVSFYAADSGIEKLLYYDRKVLGTSGQRGLCLMCYSGADRSCSDALSDSSLNCICDSVSADCDIANCVNCQVTFHTLVDGAVDGRYYSVTADVNSTATYDMDIKSNGTYKSSGRAINVVLDKPPGVSPAPPPIGGGDNIIIGDNSAPQINNPLAVYKGQNCVAGVCNKIKITISADVFDPDGIENVTFYIKDSEQNILDFGPMTSPGGDNYLKVWFGDYLESYYYVDITATDRLDNLASVTNIIPIPED